MKSYPQRNAIREPWYSVTQFIWDFVSRRNVDVESFQPIGNVHQECHEPMKMLHGASGRFEN